MESEFYYTPDEAAVYDVACRSALQVVKLKMHVLQYLYDSHGIMRPPARREIHVMLQDILSRDKKY